MPHGISSFVNKIKVRFEVKQLSAIVKSFINKKRSISESEKETLH